MPVIGLRHVAITVSDLERSVEFYTGALGLRLVGSELLGETTAFKLFGFVGGRIHCARLRAGWRGRLLLYYFDSGGSKKADENFERCGLGHLCFHVDDLDEIGRNLAPGGIEFLREPGTLPTGERIAFLRDPDGALIQLMETRISASPVGRILAPFLRLYDRLGGRTQVIPGAALNKRDLRP